MKAHIRLLRSQFALQEILRYLQIDEMLKMQLVGRKFYDSAVPKVMDMLGYYPDILVGNMSYYDRAKELFTD